MPGGVPRPADHVAAGGQTWIAEPRFGENVAQPADDPGQPLPEPRAVSPQPAAPAAILVAIGCHVEVTDPQAIEPANPSRAAARPIPPLSTPAERTRFSPKGVTAAGRPFQAFGGNGAGQTRNGVGAMMSFGKFVSCRAGAPA